MTHSRTLHTTYTTASVARLIALSVSLLWIVLPSAVAESKTEKTALRLTSDVWPPFTDVAKNPRFAIELVHEALDRSGVEAKTKIVDWNEVTPALEKGTADGSAALWHNPVREKYMLFSEPFLENRLVIVGRKGADVSAKSFADLAGKRVAMVAGYAYGDDVEKATGPEFVKGTSNQENLGKLLAKKVDYILIDELVIRHVLEHQHDEASAALEVGTSALTRRPLHFAVRKKLANASTIIKGFNEQIKKMQADGTYHRILRLRWLIADIDGDGLQELILNGLEAGENPPTAEYSIEVTAKADPLTAPLERVWIDGETYVNWGAVPERFKIRPDYEVMDPQDGIVLLRF